MLFGVLLAALILSIGVGSDVLLQNEIYGIFSTKAEIRWQLYRDSWPLLKEHWLLGIGLGFWSVHFSTYMSPVLSDIHPVFLHSDPYQFLIELGVLGALPLFLFGVSIVFLGGKTLFSERRSGLSWNGVHLLTLLLGLSAVTASSFFDFPFRIPAIQLLLSLTLATVMVLIWRASKDFQSDY